MKWRVGCDDKEIEKRWHYADRAVSEYEARQLANVLNRRLNTDIFYAYEVCSRPDCEAPTSFHVTEGGYCSVWCMKADREF